MSMVLSYADLEVHICCPLCMPGEEIEKIASHHSFLLYSSEQATERERERKKERERQRQTDTERERERERVLVNLSAMDSRWPYFDPEYETLSQRINPPRVVIDNVSCESTTVVKFDSANRPGILLEVVQLLTDLDLLIWKAYISSDGGWFMDVFHVTDQLRNKVTDNRLIEYIQQSLGARRNMVVPEVRTCLGRIVGDQAIAEHTVIELSGTDRPGLLSEITAVLAEFKCNVAATQMWTHNARIAAIVYVTDEITGGPLQENEELSVLKERLCNILKGNDDGKGAKMDFSIGLTHVERRLHQLMFADRDYEGCTSPVPSSPAHKRQVIIEDCLEKGYSIVHVRTRDRSKLLFDTVCTLTDMQYVVFHASVSADGPFAVQEYYIRHMDGSTLETEGERQRVIKCLEAAINRRVSQGIRLELSMSDRVGLLSDITRIFREHGLAVARAEVYTQGNNAVNTFYVTNASGGEVEKKSIEAIRNKIGQQILHVQGVQNTCGADSKTGFFFGNLLRLFSSNRGWVR